MNYATAAHYTPGGALAGILNGTNLSSTFIYNSRLQPCWIYATTGSALAKSTLCTGTDPGPANILDLKYNLNLGTADNGNVNGVTNNRDTTRSQNFYYDALNRLLTAETTSTQSNSLPNCWGESYLYDNQPSGSGAWGNLMEINVASTSYNRCTQEHLSTTVSAQNRLNSVGYDTAGNSITYSSSTYTYNAENQMTQATGASTVGYVYDGDGKRVEKTSSGTPYKLYWHNPDGNVLDETDQTGVTTNSNFSEYVFFGGQRIARRDSASDVFYYSADHLGTSREILQAGQTSPCYESDFYPFGGERTPIVNTCSQNNYKFTGKERDTESNLDNFEARYDSSSIGRFMSPDPDDISGVLHMDDDPQSWNAYAYVRNNPVTITDPTGAIFCRPPTVDEQKQGVAGVCDVTDNEYVDSSKQQKKAYDEEGYKHYNCSCDSGADRDAWQNPNGNASFDWWGAAVIFVGSVIAVRNVSKYFEDQGRAGEAEVGTVVEEGEAGEATFEDVLQGAVKDASGQPTKSGGFAQATKDFESLAGKSQNLGRVQVKYLPDGGKAVLRNFSTEGRATLEFQPASGGSKTAWIRYNP